MPLPKREKGEKKEKFIQRCMGNDVMNKEYPDQKQRYAVCIAQSNKETESWASTIIKWFKSHV